MSAARNRPRILLTGATGQVGWELSRTLQGLGEVVCPVRHATTDRAPVLDLADADSIRRAVRTVRPALIVNAAAYTDRDRAEQEPERALAVNGTAPGVLAEEAHRLGAALVHYSTEDVFDGRGERPWAEDDPTGPLNVYGRTRLAGETAVRDSGAAHLILRVSWVYGVHGQNFVTTMLRLGAERETLSVVCDQFGTPTSARVIADLTGQILSRGATDFAGFLREQGGTVHLACGGTISRHQFATAIFDLARRRGWPLQVRDVRPIPSAEHPCASRRPLNGRLDCTRLSERFGLVPPGWETALEQTMAALPAPVGTTATAAPPLHVVGASEAASREGAVISPPRRVWSGERIADLEVGVIYTHERQYIAPLLSTIAASADGLSLRLLLVDNVSREGTAEWEHLVPQTTVLRNARRLGYAPNLNRILRASRAPYVLLLNTDMYFDPAEQCLARMVRFMEEHPDCGVSGCRLYHPNGTYGYPARRFQTLRTIAGRRAGLGRLFGDEVGRYLYRERDPRDTFECDWLSGCFLMVRRAAFEEVGELDCGFAKYFEDVDFCLRMARAGWRVMFHGETFCYHWEQRASTRLLSRDALLHLRSWGRYLRKWGWNPSRPAAPPHRRKAA